MDIFTEFFFFIRLLSYIWYLNNVFYLYICRNTLYEIYFGKTRDIVNGLRSIQPLADSKQQEDNRKALINALASKNVAKAEWKKECLVMNFPICPCYKTPDYKEISNGFLHLFLKNKYDTTNLLFIILLLLCLPCDDAIVLKNKMIIIISLFCKCT